MEHARFSTPSDAYLAMLVKVMQQPHYRSAPRGLPIIERVNEVFVVENPVSTPLVTLDPDRNKTIAAYHAKEFALYDSGTNLAADFSAASKFWGSISNPDGTINSAYGHLIFCQPSMGNPGYESVVNPGETGLVMRTPWEWARQALEADRDTRQAVVKFALPEHFWAGNKDFVCTSHAIFQIRDSALNMTIVMRSNDLVFGTVYDLPWMCSLIHRMVAELKPAYTDLRAGCYTHIAHSLHIYERDLDRVRKMCGFSG